MWIIFPWSRHSINFLTLRPISLKLNNGFALLNTQGSQKQASRFAFVKETVSNSYFCNMASYYNSILTLWYSISPSVVYIVLIFRYSNKILYKWRSCVGETDYQKIYLWENLSDLLIPVIWICSGQGKEGNSVWHFTNGPYFCCETYWGTNVFWIILWKHWFDTTALEQQRALSLVVNGRITRWLGLWILEPGCWCLISDSVWTLGHITGPLLACFSLSRVGITVVPD